MPDETFTAECEFCGTCSEDCTQVRSTNPRDPKCVVNCCARCHTLYPVVTVNER